MKIAITTTLFTKRNMDVDACQNRYKVYLFKSLINLPNPLLKEGIIYLIQF